MKRFLLLAGIVAAMILVGYGTLLMNLRSGALEPQPVSPPPSVAIPPLAAEAAPLTTRVLVDDSAITELRAENELLKARVSRLEESRPTTRGELAVVLSLKEADLTAALDRSELLPNAKVLAEAVRHSGAASVWKALQAEGHLYRSLADFKAKNPPSEDRMGWHHGTWSPFLSVSITTVCDQLYQLNLPSTVVEPFRHRLCEGI